MKILYVSSGKMFMANLVIELIKMGHEVEALRKTVIGFM